MISILIGDCIWASWESWTTCSHSCGIGKQIRTRKVVTQGAAAESCTGVSSEEKDCNTDACPSGIFSYELDMPNQGIMPQLVFLLFIFYYCFIIHQLIVSGVAGATLVRVAKPAEVGNKPKQELLSDMRKMEELFVLEKICKKSTVILRNVLQVIISVPRF